MREVGDIDQRDRRLAAFCQDVHPAFGVFNIGH